MNKIKRAVTQLGTTILNFLLRPAWRSAPLFGVLEPPIGRGSQTLYVLLAPSPIDRVAASIVLQQLGFVSLSDEGSLVTVWDAYSLQRLQEQWSTAVDTGKVVLHVLVILWDRDPSTLPLFLKQRGISAVLSRILWAWRGGRQVGLRVFPQLSSEKLKDRLDKIARKLHLTERWIKQIVVKVHRAFAGPPIASAAEVQQKVLSSPQLKRTIASIAQETQVTESVICDQVARSLKAMASQFSPSVIRLSRPIFAWIWSKLYDRVLVEGLEPLRDWSEKGYQLLLLPNHRSHMDYLMVSYVLHASGLSLPYIAAGNNLNFWPAGAFFRRAGGFFIRRSFRGQRLYVALFRAYLSFLLRSSRHLECYIEGGRSRTGYLLEPKTGFLGAVLDEEQELLHRPMAIIPIYLSYDTVPEVVQYYQEAGLGKPKNPESGWRLLRGLFRLRRLGTVVVKFGNPLPITMYRNMRGANRLQNLGRTIMNHLQNMTQVTGSNVLSTALLTLPMSTAYPRERIIERWSYFKSLFNLFADGCFPRQLELDADLTLARWTFQKRVHRQLDVNGNQLYAWNAEQRFQYVYYRNQVQHLLCAPGLIAMLLCDFRLDSRSSFITTFHSLYRACEQYFFLSYQTADSVERQLEAVLQVFMEKGWIKPTPEGWYQVLNASQLRPLASVFESWAVQMGKLAELALRPVEARYWTEEDQKSWAQRARSFLDNAALPSISMLRRILKVWEDQLALEHVAQRSAFETWSIFLQSINIARNKPSLSSSTP